MRQMIFHRIFFVGEWTHYQDLALVQAVPEVVHSPKLDLPASLAHHRSSPEDVHRYQAFKTVFISQSMAMKESISDHQINHLNLQRLAWGIFYLGPRTFEQKGRKYK